MRRRQFIAGLGGVAAWPIAAWAQQPDRMRRVGVLMAFDENDPEAKAYLSGFTQGLAELGWTDGRNLRMDVRWATSLNRSMSRSMRQVHIGTCSLGHVAQPRGEVRRRSRRSIDG